MMPAKPDSRTEAIGFKVTPARRAKLDRACESLKISISEAMNQALKAWLKSNVKK
jgi:hypothetical protein